MVDRVARALLGASAFLLLAAPASAQGVYLHGRVEDAVWREPLTGVRVFSADSSVSVLTDSLGAFSLPVPGGPFSVRAERLGYRSERFDLGAEAPSHFSILLLKPAPVELEGVEVVGESVRSDLLGDLRRRRNGYGGPVTAFDRAQLERFASFGSVWDFVRIRTFVHECWNALSGVCARDRGHRSLRFGPLETPVLVCVDGRESWGAVAELRSMELESVSLVEFYDHGRGGIRVYTPGYLTLSASSGRQIALPFTPMAPLIPRC